MSETPSIKAGANSAPASPTPLNKTDSFNFRTALFLEKSAQACEGWFDPAGVSITPGHPDREARERFWLCFSLYAQGKSSLANAIILAAKTARPTRHNSAAHFDIFHTNVAVLLLHNFQTQMSPDVRERLTALVAEGFGLLPGNRAPEFQFHGYNDNMPAKATMGLILGGELLGNTEAVDHGRQNLRQFAAQLSRRGINSEFNSPTYTPLTLHAVAEIAHYAKDEESRQLARDIESRLWVDLAARFHPGIGSVSGPYSRAYAVDAVGHVSGLSCLLWFVLGDVVRPSPMEIFNPDADLVFHHAGDRTFNAAQMAWIAGGAYHLPEQARDIFLKKTFPFRSVAVAEVGNTSPDIPARALRIETYLEKDYTLGTMSSPFLGGEQSAGYFVTYKRKEDVKSVQDIGTVFHKFVINGDVPGVPHPDCPESGAEADLLISKNGAFIVQHESTALVLSYPQLALGGKSDDHAAKAPPLSGIEEQIIFPAHFGGADEIIVGGVARQEWSGEVNQGEWIVCRRGRLLIAIRPLAYTGTLGRPRIHLERINRYDCLRVTFYQGAARSFERGELRQIFGGFVAEHASVDAFPSLAAFASHLEPAKFSDYLWTTRRVRYRRPQLDIEVSISPGAYEPRYATINQRQVAWPDVAIDGISRDQLPLNPATQMERPAYFPWEIMELSNMAGSAVIGDREETE